MWSRWTGRARSAVWAANDLAAAQGQSQVTPEQLLFAVLRDDNVACKLLRRLDVDPDALRGQVLQALPESNSAVIGEQPSWWPMKPVLDAAYTAAWDLNTNYIGTEHLLLALLCTPTRAQDLLRHEGLAPEPIREAWLALRDA